MNYNRVLILTVPMRRLDSQGRAHHVVDGSALPFIVEQLIACCASRVLLPKNSIAGGFADSLPNILKDRVSIIDDEDVIREHGALFSSIAEEFGLEMLGPGGLRHRGQHGKDMESALARFYFDLHSLLMGLRFKAEIELDIESLRAAAKRIRLRSRSAEARLVAATIEGLLSSYVEVEAPSLRFASTIERSFLRDFRTLTEDVTYRELVKEAHFWGVPQRFRYSIKRCRRLAEKLLTDPPLRKVFELGSAVVTAATSFPTPDSETAEIFLQGGYLPPIVSLKEALRTAEESWRSVNPEFIPPSGWPC